MRRTGRVRAAEIDGVVHWSRLLTES